MASRWIYSLGIEVIAFLIQKDAQSKDSGTRSNSLMVAINIIAMKIDHDPERIVSEAVEIILSLVDIVPTHIDDDRGLGRSIMIDSRTADDQISVLGFADHRSGGRVFS